MHDLHVGVWGRDYYNLIIISNSGIINNIYIFSICYVIAEVGMAAGGHHRVPSTGCVGLWVYCGWQESGGIQGILRAW